MPLWQPRKRGNTREGGSHDVQPGHHSAESAKANPSKPAILSGAGALTYAELDALSDRFASGLRRQGVLPGQAVALQLPNLPSFFLVIAYFGTLKAGSVVVPLNVLLKAPEVAYQLTNSRACLLVTWAGVAAEAAKGAADAGLDRIYVVTLPGSSKVPVWAAPSRSSFPGSHPIRRSSSHRSQATRRPSCTRRGRRAGPRERAQPLPALHERRDTRPALRHRG